MNRVTLFGVAGHGAVAVHVLHPAPPHPLAEPLDWQRAVYPSRWRLMDRERTYDWVGGDGAGLPRDAA